MTEIIVEVESTVVEVEVDVSSGFLLPESSGGGGGGAVDSVNGETGVVVLSAADVGAASTGALASHEADTTNVHGISNTTLLETTSGAQTKATAAQTAAASYTDTAVSGEATARNAAITAAVNALLDSPPGTLDTLNELAAALGDDPNFATTITTALAGKQPLDADLTAIAALATTAFGRSLLTQADASAARTVLALAAVAASGSAGDLSETATAKVLTDTERTKLAGVATGATANDTDANLKNRANHTGTQLAATISDLSKSSVGLGNVDNTSDANKPVSTAQAAADAAVAAAAQPLDADLTAIAALSTTAYGRAFLALADAAAGRTALGLGTAALSASGDFQPVDSDLTAIAALSTTSYGRGLLVLANQAALTAAIAAATTSLPGAVELATDAEVTTGTDTSRAVVPASLPSRILDKSYPTISPGIVNTTAETDVMSFTVPASRIQALDILEFEYAYDLLNNSGSAVTVVWRFKLGATTVLDAAAISHSSGTGRFEGMGRVRIGLASLTDQRWSIVHDESVSAASQILLAANSLRYTGSSSENLATDKTLKVTAQMSAASASADIRPHYGALARYR